MGDLFRDHPFLVIGGAVWFTIWVGVMFASAIAMRRHGDTLGERHSGEW